MSVGFKMRAYGALLLVLSSATVADAAVPSREKALKDGFTVDLSVDFEALALSPAKTNEVLCRVGSVELAFRTADPKSRYDALEGNYCNFPLADGSCPVIEATICPKAGRVGIPLGLLECPNGVHAVTLNFSPVHWSICVDGHVDDDMPVPKSPVTWPDNLVETVCSPRVKSHRIVSPARYSQLPIRPDAKPIGRSIQYWSPDGHDAWVGDVTVTTWKDRLHVFYLFDRRHHGSGDWAGRHYFAHVSSGDLGHWVEHPLAVPIDEWWECIGTGTPFAWKGKLCLAYGLHTGRMACPEARDKPVGGFYVESDDGVHFRKTGVRITDDENPSVYNREDGRLGLACVRDLFVSEGDGLGPWKKVNAPKKSGGDCPAPFEWNGHQYLMQGFHWFDHSTNGVDFADWTATGEDVYEGLGVPMVAKWRGNRRILAGWLPGWFWAGWLVFRELVQYPDGRLGTKWVPEIKPPVEPVVWKDVRPDRDFAVTFENGQGAAFEFRIEPAERRAQFADTVPGKPAPRVESLRERKSRIAPKDIRDRIDECSIHRCGSFAIENIRGLDRPFGVRLVSWYDRKGDKTIFDAEIAGQRTMICTRDGRWTRCGEKAEVK